MSDTADELRLVAKEARLDGYDRAIVARAADELDEVQRQLLTTQQALIESQGQRIATNERFLELLRARNSTMPSSGLTFRLLPVTPGHWVYK